MQRLITKRKWMKVPVFNVEQRFDTAVKTKLCNSLKDYRRDTKKFHAS